MDFGSLGLEGFVNPDGISSQISDPDVKRKVFGSGFVTEEKSGEDEWSKSSKMVKIDDFSNPKAMPFRHGSPLLRSNSLLPAEGNPQEEMLSFSSLKSESPFLTKNGGFHRNAGYGSVSMNANMHGSFAGVRGAFTPSQWIELEHQALIYKYITANVPVPSNLLIPLKKSFSLYGLSSFSAGSYPPTSLGWGSYHLGYSGNTDPEPGRCRRTDGKKWRCSRDAVADQKYCERHINRGRHRSRKPVEGQTGHASSGTTSSMSMSVISSGGASNNVVIPQHQFKNMQTGATDPSAGVLVSRIQVAQNRNIMSSTINLKSKESTVHIPKQNIPFGGSSQSDFGLVSSDSLLNPSQKNSYIGPKIYASFLDFSDQETQDQHPLRHFIDDWPKDQSNHSVITWPEELKSDWPQLSMSIPMASSGFSSSSSSPTQEKLALSPLRLSRDFDPIQMGLRMSSALIEPTQKQTNWIPITWETSMGGPLGEVLTCGAGTEGWDVNQHFGSSPTGVLQKLTFGSMSNSSSGSSPRADNKNQDRVSFYDDVLGSSFL